MSGMLVWPTRWKQSNNWAPPQILRPKTCKPHRAHHLAIGVCKLSHISSYIFAKNSLRFKECTKAEVNNGFEDEGRIYKNIKEISLLPKITPLMLCKVCIRVATFDGSEHSHMSSQHNKNMTTSRLNILIISKFGKSGVQIFMLA